MQLDAGSPALPHVSPARCQLDKSSPEARLLPLSPSPSSLLLLPLSSPTPPWAKGRKTLRREFLIKNQPLLIALAVLAGGKKVPLVRTCTCRLRHMRMDY